MRNKEGTRLFLRSEKVRSIVGQIPPSIVRFGTSIIAGVILLLLLLSYIIPIKEYEIVKMDLNTRPAIQICKMPMNGIFYFFTKQDKVLKDQMIGSVHNGIDSVTNFYSCLNGNIILFCENGDYIKKGDIIFSIIPDTINQIYGISYINSNLKRKIRKGQQVFFYQSDISGSVIGSVSKCCPMEKSNANTTRYKIEVSFDEKSFMNQKKKTFLATEMHGTAKILITDKSILKRIIDIGE